MGGLTVGLHTKSAKIRALDAAGYSRSEIAEFLEIRYQHVRNVLVQGGEIEPPREFSVDIGPGGRIVIPAPYRQALGLSEGDQVLLSLVDDEVLIASRRSKIRRAQNLLAKYVSSDVDLAAELIAERRQDASREEGEDGGRG
jgi:AbrB family looped-hinge helix DNA binding protein